MFFKKKPIGYRITHDHIRVDLKNQIHMFPRNVVIEISQNIVKIDNIKFHFKEDEFIKFTSFIGIAKSIKGQSLKLHLTS